MEVVLLHKSLIGDRRWQWVSHVPRTWHHHQHYDHQNLWSSWGVRENVIPLAAGCWAEESWNVLRNIMNDDEEQSSSCSKSLSMVVEVEVGEDERGTAAAIEKAAEWTLQLWIVQCPDTSNSAHHFGLWLLKLPSQDGRAEWWTRKTVRIKSAEWLSVGLTYRHAWWAMPEGANILPLVQHYGRLAAAPPTCHWHLCIGVHIVGMSLAFARLSRRYTLRERPRKLPRNALTTSEVRAMFGRCLNWIESSSLKRNQGA